MFEEDVPVRILHPQWNRALPFTSGLLQDIVNLDMSFFILYTLVGAATSTVLLIWVGSKMEQHGNHPLIILFCSHVKRVSAEETTKRAFLAVDVPKSVLPQKPPDAQQDLRIAPASV